MEDKLLTILINGGLASVSLSLIYVLYHIVTNHLSHANETNERLEVAITKLITLLEEKLK